MFLRRTLTVVVLFSALLIHSMSDCFAQEHGWVLTQKSLTFGDQYLYISPSGFKCVNPKAGIAFVTRAPNWDVIIFNDRTKVYYATTFDQWKRQLAGRMTNERNQVMSQGNWNRGQTGSIAGLRATQFVMAGTNRGLQHIANRKGRQHLSQVSSASYWVSEDIQVPPRLAEMLANIYGLPTTVSVPLRLQYATGQGNRLALDTYRSQSCPIPITYYNSPSNYKAVQSDVEVMADEETKQMIDDMSRELGGSTPSGTTGGGGKVTNQDLDKFLDAFRKKK